MECKNIEILLWNLIDNKLDINTKNEILNHLKNCSVCKQKYILLLNVNEIIENQRCTSINPFIETRILQKIEKEKKTKYQKILQPALIAILILFSVFVGNKTANFITYQTQKSSNNQLYQNNDSVYFYVFNNMTQEEYQFFNNK